MKQQISVFVCSTQVDLEDERGKVLDSIGRVQLHYNAMEYFGARTEKPLEVCLELVKRSDVLVVIVGRVYGSLIPDGSKSFVEAEYDEGRRLGKMCLVYLSDDSVPILPRHYEQNPDNIRRLENFRSKLLQNHTVARYKDAANLGLQVAVDLTREIERQLGRARVSDNDPLKLIKLGAETWNTWRLRNPDVKPDLNEADLSSLDLSFYDLSETNLSYANLSKARLHKADLSRADMARTSLNDCELAETMFIDVDLTLTEGLDNCRFESDCNVDIKTLQRSKSVPVLFLRMCGLPDSIIDYLPSLFEQTVEFYSCFISYSSKDQEFANRLHADLQDNGVRCWFAPHDLPIGTKTWEGIGEAIRTRDKVLVVLSKAALTSDWIEDEVTTAFAEERRRKELVLFPVRLDEAVMESDEPWAGKLRDNRNIGDFTQWKDPNEYQATLDRVLRDLRTGS